MLDLASLLALAIWQEKSMSVPRLVLASLLATGLGCLAYLFLHSFWGYVIFVVFLVNPLMLLLAFERIAPKALAVLYFRLLIVYAGLGGLVSLLDLYLPAEIRDFLLPLACALFFLLTVIASILQARKREQREVAILVCGHVEKMQALADTGNLLRDPISGRPVCVVSEDYKEKWKIPADRMRLIAYETVAGQDFMEIVAADKFLMKEAGKMVSQKEILLGFGKASLFQGKNYQMILHKDFCWE